MHRAQRGLDTPAETVGQDLDAVKAFNEFLKSAGLSSDALDKPHASLTPNSTLPMQSFYSLLTAFIIFLQTKKSDKARAVDGFLSKSNALGYFSHFGNLLRERYSNVLSDSKRVAKIRGKMASAIEERNLRANVQTNAAPGRIINVLCVLVESLEVHTDVTTGLKYIHDTALLTMMWHTFGRAIDTCFARKQQLSMTASGEQFLRTARIKTSVVLGVSIYKSPERWKKSMPHAFGLLFACYDEPPEYLFPLVPRYAVSDLPGSQMYTQEEAVIYWESLPVGRKRRGRHDSEPELEGGKVEAAETCNQGLKRVVRVCVVSCLHTKAGAFWFLTRAELRPAKWGASFVWDAKETSEMEAAGVSDIRRAHSIALARDQDKGLQGRGHAPRPGLLSTHITVGSERSKIKVKTL